MVRGVDDAVDPYCEHLGEDLYFASGRECAVSGVCGIWALTSLLALSQVLPLVDRCTAVLVFVVLTYGRAGISVVTVIPG